MICGLPLTDGQNFKDPIKEIVKTVINKRRMRFEDLKDHTVDE
jgi:hypothetical protein